jgi:serine/threonine protein kinase
MSVAKARAGLSRRSSLSGRYELCEPIGRGGMAEVFRARLQSLGGFTRDVAVKVLLPQFAAEPEFVDMLLDEARIAGAIVHPCVVQMLDVGRSGEVFYLVMEYVAGVDLRTIARALPSGMLPLPMALFVVGEVLRGLGAVHAAVDDRGRPRKIVHRDVSPANVLIDDSGAVKLGDFGIAHASGRLTCTRVGSVKGKSRYMAPEQLAPSAGQPVDHRADLYAVGVTLFEALLGDVARESSYATPYGPMFTWPRVLPPERVPADVAALLQRAVVDDPRQRFADAASFRRAVVAALQQHAPGYDAESLAQDLRRLRGEASDLAADDDRQTLAESPDVATTRGSRPQLAVVPLARSGPLAAAAPAHEAVCTRPPSFTAAPSQTLYGDDEEGGLFAVAERSGGYRALPFTPSSALRLPRSETARWLWLAAGGVLMASAIATAIAL